MKTITIAGKLGRDAELKYTNAGGAYLKFSVAVDSKVKGEKKTDWFACTIFGKRGEVLAKYLTKGTVVSASGTLEARTYQAKDGATKLDLGVIVDQVSLLGGGQRDGNGPPQAGNGGGFGGDEYPPGSDDFGDDTPF